MFVARLLELCDGSFSDEVVFVDWPAPLSCCCAVANEAIDTNATQATISRVSPNFLMILSKDSYLSALFADHPAIFGFR
jgi:hypothetical protein